MQSIRFAPVMLGGRCRWTTSIGGSGRTVAKPGGRNIASAVKETLDSVVSPSVRDAILGRALAAAQMKQLPNDAPTLGEFVAGPLHDSLVQSLGSALGVSVTTEIERVVALAAPHDVMPVRDETKPPARRPSTKLSATGASRRPSRSTMPSREAFTPGSAVSRDKRWAEAEARGISPTMPVGRIVQDDEIVGEGRRASQRTGQGQPVSADFPVGTATALGVIGTASVEPSSGGRPLVYVASTDRELLRVFQAWLDMRAKVEVVTSMRDLVVRLVANETARVVIVLDGKQPAIRPLALAAFAEEMSATTQVLLWGVPPHLHAKMRNVSVATEKWLVYGSDATTNELVARCAKIVG